MSALGKKSAKKSHSATRTAVLDAVRRSERPVTVQEIAAELDLHANSVRFHLSRLLQAGELREHQADPDGPGRPRMVYVATPVPAQDAEPNPGAGSGPSGTAAAAPGPATAPSAPTPGPGATPGPMEGRGYQFLAEMLAGHLAATADDPEATATAVGEAWGRYLSGRPVPFSRVTEEESVARITEILDRAGFSPARHGADSYRLELRTCPFRTVADREPGVVCSIHLGLMRGVLAEMNAPVEVVRLDRFEAPFPCLTHLRAVGATRTGTADAGADSEESVRDEAVEELPGWAGRIAG
jgi:predicted ArsR family transcriptional regulator